jgi:hypothetical protein
MFKAIVKAIRLQFTVKMLRLIVESRELVEKMPGVVDEGDHFHKLSCVLEELSYSGYGMRVDIDRDTRCIRIRKNGRAAVFAFNANIQGSWDFHDFVVSSDPE